MPSFSSTPITLSSPGTLTYDAPVTTWVFGSRSLLRSGAPVVPPQNLDQSFQVGPIRVGPAGASATVTFVGSWWFWLFVFFPGTYSLSLKIRPAPQSPEHTVDMPLARQVSTALIFGRAVEAKLAPSEAIVARSRTEASARSEPPPQG